MNKLKRNSLFLIVIGAIVLIFSVSFIKNFNNSRVTEENHQFFMDEENIVGAEVETEPEPELVVANIVVDLKGAVNDPGVYIMEKGDRVVDVIEDANGFQKGANKDLINLALLLEDEMVIYVPRHGEADSDTVHLTPATNKDNEKLNINRATAEELEKLPGIGPVKATAIVSFREEQGTFNSIEDIVQVPGIGQKSLEALSEFIKAK